jgi:RNA polymerase sigma factor (sigma-70 family)
VTDSDLVRGLRDRDPTAVKHLKECFLPSIWRFVYVRTNGNRHLAEDIVSDAVLALIRAVGEGFEFENVAGWLRTVAANKLRDHFRAAVRVQHLLQQGRASGVDGNGDPAALQEGLERRQEVWAVMDALPEQHRLVLEWKYVEALSVREIAGRIDTTEKAAESILFRARQEFRQIRERQQKAAASPVGNVRQIRQQKPVDIEAGA